MGATTFVTTAKGTTADDAFRAATEDARYEYGHGGYTGTIAEKSEYRLFTLPEGMTPRQVIRLALSGAPTPEELAGHRELLEQIAETADDKWGPAACLKTGEEEYTFFGWASE